MTDENNNGQQTSIVLGLAQNALEKADAALKEHIAVNRKAIIKWLVDAPSSGPLSVNDAADENRLVDIWNKRASGKLTNEERDTILSLLRPSYGIFAKAEENHDKSNQDRAERVAELQERSKFVFSALEKLGYTSDVIEKYSLRAKFLKMEDYTVDLVTAQKAVKKHSGQVSVNDLYKPAQTVVAAPAEAPKATFTAKPKVQTGEYVLKHSHVRKTAAQKSGMAKSLAAQKSTIAVDPKDALKPTQQMKLPEGVEDITQSAALHSTPLDAVGQMFSAAANVSPEQYEQNRKAQNHVRSSLFSLSKLPSRSELREGLRSNARKIAAIATIAFVTIGGGIGGYFYSKDNAKSVAKATVFKTVDTAGEAAIVAKMEAELAAKIANTQDTLVAVNDTVAAPATIDVAAKQTSTNEGASVASASPKSGRAKSHFRKNAATTVAPQTVTDDAPLYASAPVAAPTAYADSTLQQQINALTANELKGAIDDLGEANVDSVAVTLDTLAVTTVAVDSEQDENIQTHKPLDDNLTEVAEETLSSDLEAQGRLAKEEMQAELDKWKADKETARLIKQAQEAKADAQADMDKMKANKKLSSNNIDAAPAVAPNNNIAKQDSILKEGQRVFAEKIAKTRAENESALAAYMAEVAAANKKLQTVNEAASKQNAPTVNNMYATKAKPAVDATPKAEPRFLNIEISANGAANKADQPKDETIATTPAPEKKILSTKQVLALANSVMNGATAVTNAETPLHASAPAVVKDKTAKISPQNSQENLKELSREERLKKIDDSLAATKALKEKLFGKTGTAPVSGNSDSAPMMYQGKEIVDDFDGARDPRDTAAKIGNIEFTNSHNVPVQYVDTKKKPTFAELKQVTYMLRHSADSVIESIPNKDMSNKDFARAVKTKDAVYAADQNAATIEKKVQKKEEANTFQRIRTNATQQDFEKTHTDGSTKLISHAPQNAKELEKNMRTLQRVGALQKNGLNPWIMKQQINQVMKREEKIGVITKEYNQLVMKAAKTFYGNNVDITTLVETAMNREYPQQSKFHYRDIKPAQIAKNTPTPGQ